MPTFSSLRVFVDQPLVALGDVVAQVLEAFLPRAERAGHAPDDHARPPVDLHGHAAMGDRAAAGHAQRPADQDVAHRMSISRVISGLWGRMISRGPGSSGKCSR